MVRLREDGALKAPAARGGTGGTPGIAERIGPALLQLILQQAARDVTRGQAAGTIAAFLGVHQANLADARETLSHPLRSWGPFEALSREVRLSLAAAASFHLREVAGLTNPIAGVLTYGPSARSAGR